MEQGRDYQYVYSNTTKDIRARVRALHARMRVEYPEYDLRMMDVFLGCMRYALDHDEAVMQEISEHHHVQSA